MQSAQELSWTKAMNGARDRLVRLGHTRRPALSSEAQDELTCISAAFLNRLSGQVALLTSVQPAGRS